MTERLEGARRVIETTDADKVNQYLRFGWKLINQHVIEATIDGPGRIKYVLASVRLIEETKELVMLHDMAAVNEHLALGWTLLDKFVTQTAGPQRDEAIHFVLAWQSEDAPVKPGTKAAQAVSVLREQLSGDIELDLESRK